MTDDGLDRGSSYRPRLARAAAASFALHMIFFGGLSVSRLDFAIERPADSEADEPEKRKKAADFRLQVSRSTQAQQPAHERSLTLPVPTDAARPAEARTRPTERSVADRREVAPETEPTVTPSQPEFERSRPVDQAEAMQPTEALDRVAEVTPTESQATADVAAAAAATEAAPSSSAAPATAQPRNRGEPGPVAARWRPREVALLEKLTARAPDASSLAARPAADAPAPPRSGRIARRSTAHAARPPATQAEAIAAAATEASSLAPAATPQARDTSHRPALASAAATQPALPAAATSPSSTAITTVSPGLASITRSPSTAGATGSTASATAGSRSPARAAGVTAGDVAGATTVAGAAGAAPAVVSSGGGSALAPATAASGGTRSGRQRSRGSTAGQRSAAAGRGRIAAGGSDASGPSSGTVTSGGSGGLGGLRDLGEGLSGGREGLAGGAGTASEPRSPGRDTGSLASGPTGAGGLVTVDPTGGGGLGAGGDTGQAAAGGSGAGGAGAGLMPAAIDRGSRRRGSRSAVASRDGGRGEGDAASEGLSVTSADIAAVVAAGRQRAAASSQPQGPRSLKRITTSALPTDGRVRDVAQAFAGRSGGGSEPAGGITDRETLDRARAMVDRGLAFLVRSQLPDGRWKLTEYAGVTPADVPKLESDTAATGLALLCFLGAGHDHFSGPHRDTVRRGLEFLIASQQEDGDLFVPADDLSNSCGWLYSHGIASIAVCEAVGMTGDPLVKPAAEKACRFIATSRHPTLGGWRYVPRTDADLSVSGWMLVALRAGDLAGVKTDPAALDGVRMLVDASASPSDPARYAYNARKADQRRTDLSVACMTAVGTLMRLHTGGTADDPRILAASKLLARLPPAYGTRSQRVRDSYLWYYASQVLVHTGGNDWQAWYESLVGALEANQRENGPLAGSWDAMGSAPDRWGEYGGRLYVTTLHILALEVPWRHLPTYATAPSR